MYSGFKRAIDSLLSTDPVRGQQLKAPVKPNISIDLLERVDIRVDTNKLVEDVKGYREQRRVSDLTAFDNEQKPYAAVRSAKP